MSLAPVPAKAGLPSARSLFERARQARLAGDAHRAAAAFEELVRLHPRDERAGYAAFMLGRLRLDELDDARGAVEALSLALSRAKPDDFFVEDAQARRVEALAKQGDHEGCRRARSQFLAEYPASAHVALVRQLCEERR